MDTLAESTTDIIPDIDQIAYVRKTIPRYISQYGECVLDNVSDYETFESFYNYVTNKYPSILLHDMYDIWIRYHELFAVHYDFAMCMLKTDVEKLNVDTTIPIKLNTTYQNEIAMHQMTYETNQLTLDHLATIRLVTSRMSTSQSTVCATIEWHRDPICLFGLLVQLGYQNGFMVGFRGYTTRHHGVTDWIKQAPDDQIRILIQNNQITIDTTKPIYFTMTSSSIDALHNIPIPKSITYNSSIYIVEFFTGIPVNADILTDILWTVPYAKYMFYRRYDRHWHYDLRNVTQNMSHKFILIDSKTNIMIHATLNSEQSGQKCCRATFNCENNHTANQIFHRLQRLMTLYMEHAPRIYETYRKLLPKCQPEFHWIASVASYETSEGNQRMRKMRQENPDVFASQFSRMVCKDRLLIPMPIPLQGSHNTETQIIFPKPGMSQTTAPKLYVSSNPKYPYAGLIINNLSNSNELPVLPCGFTKPQLHRDIYKCYMKANTMDELKILLNQQRATKKTNRTRVLMTKKVASYGERGVLPTSVTDILPEKYTYYRRGVTILLDDESLERKSSVLFAVAMAMGVQFHSDTAQDRIQWSLNVRLELAQKYSNACTQECWDMNIDDVVRNIGDQNIFLDPRRYIRAIELYFKCNIFIFNTDGIVIPHHSPNAPYMIWKTSHCTPLVLVYIHRGGVYTSKEICELITTDSSVFFKNKDASYVWSMYHNLVTSIFQNRIMTPIDNSFTQNVTGQIVDIFGKTIAVQIDGYLFWSTIPLPSLNVPIVSPFSIQQNYNQSKLILTSDTVLYTQSQSLRPQYLQDEEWIWYKRLTSGWCNPLSNIEVDAIKFFEQQSHFFTNDPPSIIYVPTHEIKQWLTYIKTRDKLNGQNFHFIPAMNHISGIIQAHSS